MNRKTLLLITFFTEGGLLVFGLLFIGGPSTMQSKFDLSWSATFYALLLSLPMFVALYVSVRSRWKPLSQLRSELYEKVVPIFAKCQLIDLVMISFLAGVGEELFFRGWMQGALSDRLGMWMGILIASAIFGFAHYLSSTYAIYAFITGIYLGAIYQISENLYIVMTIHTVYDFVALMYLIRVGRRKETEIQKVEE